MESHEVKAVFKKFVDTQNIKLKQDDYTTFDDYLDACNSIQWDAEMLRQELAELGYQPVFVGMLGSEYTYRLAPNK